MFGNAAKGIAEVQKDGKLNLPVCAEDLIRVDDAMESPELAE